MTLNKIKKIYILAPSKTYTGGPEALHQLAFTIKNKTKYKNVSMYYLPNSTSNSVHSNFKKYNLPVAKKIEDSVDNLLVAGELYEDIKFLQNYKKINKAIWWLSFDNYLLSLFRNNNNKITQKIIKIPFKIIKLFNFCTNYFYGDYIFFDFLKDIYLKNRFFNNLSFKNINYHFTQSSYAKKILENNGHKTFNISDYLNNDFFKNKYNKSRKENIVTYNKTKSTNFMKLILKKNTSIKFVPLINLSKKEMIDILKKSKIYLDFGTHPGKDRIPREAAILGNCVLVNKKGSAQNKYDIAIPSEFKFNERYQDIKKINNKINKILLSYDSEYKKFSSYVSKIKNEEKIFVNQVKSFFISGI